MEMTSESLNETLSILTVSQLRAMAKDNGVDLGKAKNKAEIIDVISAAILAGNVALSTLKISEGTGDDNTPTTEAPDAPHENADGQPSENETQTEPSGTTEASATVQASTPNAVTATDAITTTNATAPDNAPADNSSGKKPAFTLNRVLRVTKPLIKGEDVKAVQAALIARKYHCGVGGAGGTYNADTAHAVRMFQAANRLIVSGQVDKFTAQKLGGKWVNKPAAPTAPK